MKRILHAIAACTFIILFSCNNKETDSVNSSRLEVRLTDDPAGYQAILLDVQDVQINVTGDGDEGWQSLANVKKGVYNVLDLVNDKDTLLASADIPSGRLHQIRLVLGPNNSVNVNGTSIPLETPSGQQSGLKLNIQQDVMSGLLYTLLLDFDAAKSIVKTGNGKYILKPVIRTVVQAAGGSIAGYVKPFDIRTAVIAINGNDTVASTFTSTTGAYLLKGLAAGSYDLHYVSTDTSYSSAVKVAVPVAVGQITKLDTVFLQK